MLLPYKRLQTVHECLNTIKVQRALTWLSFLSRTFTIHKTAVEGGGYLFNSSLPLPLASQSARLMSKCLWSGGSGRGELNRYPPSSPAVLWIVNVHERKPRELKIWLIKHCSSIIVWFFESSIKISKTKLQDIK